MGDFWYGMHGFLYKKKSGGGTNRLPSLMPRNIPAEVTNKYVPGAGVGASSVATRRSKYLHAYNSPYQVNRVVQTDNNNNNNNDNNNDNNPVILQAPTNLTATVEYQEITLSWDSPYNTFKVIFYLTSLGSNYPNVISNNLTSKSVNVAGLSLDASYTFVVSAVQSNATGLTATVVGTPTTPSINTPDTFSDIISTTVPSSITINSTIVTSLSHLNRYSISCPSFSSSKFLSITDSYGLTFGTVNASSTYKDYLLNLFQAVEDIYNGAIVSTTHFRFDSDYHTNYSLDVNSSGVLQFVNNWGSGRVNGNGYICFAYSASKFQAINRYKYDSTLGYHVADTSFSFANYYMYFDTGAFAAGTNPLKLRAIITPPYIPVASFNVYLSPLSESIPASFNPSSIAYVTNTRVSINNSINNTIPGMESTIAKDMMTKYQPQITAMGIDSGTTAASDLVLATIVTSVSQQGNSLRYSTSLYKSFREKALQMTLKSNSVGNGTVGQNTVPYVYFTCEADTVGIYGIAGTYHPFMCIASFGISDRPNGLVDIARPPGDGSGSYPSSKVTRDSTMGYVLAKIPMLDYGVIGDDPTGNTTPAIDDSNLLDDSGYTGANKPAPTVYNYSSIKAAGIMIDGVDIFPAMNNSLNTSQFQGEISAHGHHVGRDLRAGLHYHSDGHAGNNDNVFQIYNTSDYVGLAHPPLIGFSFDGIALFGIYDHDYDTMDGYDTVLDSFGGHSHGTYGYHYHSHDEVITETAHGTIPSNGLYDYTIIYGGSPPSLTYTEHVLLNGAWKGQIDHIPYFWSDSPPTGPFEPDINGNQSTVYVGKESTPPPP